MPAVLTPPGTKLDIQQAGVDPQESQKIRAQTICYGLSRPSPQTRSFVKALGPALFTCAADVEALLGDVRWQFVRAREAVS